MKWHRWGATWLVCMSAGALAAVPAAPATAQRERIATERAAAMARFTEQERACQARFVVTSCVEAAQREQRATLTRLHRQELQLDEARRRDAAAIRVQAIRDRVAAQAARAADAVSEAAADTAREARKPSPAAVRRPVDSGPPRSGVAGASIQDRRAFEQRNLAKFEARVRAAQAHRVAEEHRNAQRATQGKVVAPLPVPSGASAP